MNEVIIRKAKMNDLNEISLLLKEFKELGNPSGEPNHLWWLGGLIKEQVFIISEVNRKIVGLAIGEVTSGNLAFLHLVCVKKEFQGKGIGKRLYSERERLLKKRGAKAIMAYVNSKNKRALRILKKNKFERGQLVYEHIKFLK